MTIRRNRRSNVTHNIRIYASIKRDRGGGIAPVYVEKSQEEQEKMNKLVSCH